MNAETTEYAYLGSMPLIALKRSNINASVNWISANHLYTPHGILRKNGSSLEAIWRWDTDPYGSMLPTEIVKFTMNLRFPGQVYDKETGTHYNVFRDYDPQTGRYLQADPIGLGGGMNRWGYVGGNPMNGVDPLGLVLQVFTGAIIGGGVDLGMQIVKNPSIITDLYKYVTNDGLHQMPYYDFERERQKRWDCLTDKINWDQVSTAAVIGAATGGVGNLLSMETSTLKLGWDFARTRFLGYEAIFTNKQIFTTIGLNTGLSQWNKTVNKKPNNPCDCK